MKRLLLLCLTIGSFMLSLAQQTAKHDVVLKLNGEELTGKVLKITDSEIEFAYAGETLAYAIKKSDIMKITYASGRIEIITKTSLPSGNSASSNNNAPAAGNLEDHHNKVAILPFSFVRDGQPTADAISEQAQNECFSMLSKHAGVYTVLNPRTTNAMLIKAGVNANTIKGFTMNELCNILGVEYVVDCMVSVAKTTQTFTQANSGQVKDKNADTKKFNTYSSGTAVQNYKTSLTLGIYNDKGNTIYSQERSSFFATQDAYKNTLEYLLKRTPLYTK